MGWIVYKHTFPDGKVYYGITSRDENERWLDGKGYMNQPVVFDAIIKYGWDNIRHEVVETFLTEEEARAAEKSLIMSKGKGQTYNVAYKTLQDEIVGKDDNIYRLCGGIPDSVVAKIEEKYECMPFHFRLFDDRVELLSLEKTNEGFDVLKHVAFYPNGGIAKKRFSEWLNNVEWVQGVHEPILK